MGTNDLRRLRRDQGLALWGLAARTGVSATTLSAVERWGYMPSLHVRRRIADALGVDVLAIWPGCCLDGEERREDEHATR